MFCLFPDPSIKPFYKDLINFHSSCDVTKVIMTSVGKDARGADALFRNNSPISHFCSFFFSFKTFKELCKP